MKSFVPALMIVCFCVSSARGQVEQSQSSTVQEKHHHHHRTKKHPGKTDTAPSTSDAQTTPDSPPPAKTVDTKAIGEPSSPKVPVASDFNFELDAQPKPTPADNAARALRVAILEGRVRLRRKMLQAHQAFGFITLGALAATLVIGQLNYLDKYNGTDTGRYYNAHLGLAVGTTLTFTTTGLLALFAPNPYPKPIKADAALLHKIMMALATAGMAAQLLLGPITASREGKLDQRNYALAHLVTGYATWAFMATGVLAYVF